MNDKYPMTDHVPNDLSHLSEEEFNSLCPQGEHAPVPAMTENFRALCEELIRVNDDVDNEDWIGAWSDAIDRTKAALAEQPTLKEQALSELDALENMGACNSKTIRRALEALPE